MGRGLVSVAKLGAAAGAALLAVSKSGASAADEQRKQSQAVGLSIEEYGKLRFALNQSGVEAEQATRIFAQLNDAVQSDGPNKAKDAIAALFAIFGSIGPAVRILLAAFGGVPLAIGLIVGPSRSSLRRTKTRGRPSRTSLNPSSTHGKA